MFKICGLIRQTIVNNNMMITIQKKKYISFLTENKVSNIEIDISKLSVSLSIRNGFSRRDVSFIRIDQKTLFPYTKVLVQYNKLEFPPPVRIYYFCRIFLHSIIFDISGLLSWIGKNCISIQDIMKSRTIANPTILINNKSIFSFDNPIFLILNIIL